MTNPAYVKWVLMRKGGEEKLVHPGNVNNHIRFGWTRAEQPQTEPQVVSVETPTEPESVMEPEADEEEIVALDDETSAEPESVEPLEDADEESMTDAARKVLTPKPRTSKPKKDK